MPAQVESVRENPQNNNAKSGDTSNFPLFAPDPWDTRDTAAEMWHNRRAVGADMAGVLGADKALSDMP